MNPKGELTRTRWLPQGGIPRIRDGRQLTSRALQLMVKQRAARNGVRTRVTEGERLLLAGRVEAELDQHAPVRGLRIGDPGSQLHLDSRQEGVRLPLSPNIRDRVLSHRRHAGHRPLDLLGEHLACGLGNVNMPKCQRS